MEVTFIVVVFVVGVVLAMLAGGAVIALVLWVGQQVKDLDQLAQVGDERVARILTVTKRLVDGLAIAVAGFVALALYWTTLNWHAVAVIAMACAGACLWGLGYVRKRRRAGVAAWRTGKG